MAFWQNENEKYPDDDNFLIKRVIDETGEVILVTAGVVLRSNQ